MRTKLPIGSRSNARFVTDCHGAMLLMHHVDRQPTETPERVGIADVAITGTGKMLVGADILGQRKRAGIENDRVALAVVPDHRGQHRDCDLVLAAHVARELREVPHHVDAGARLGDAA